MKLIHLYNKNVFPNKLAVIIICEVVEADVKAGVFIRGNTTERRRTENIIYKHDARNILTIGHNMVRTIANNKGQRRPILSFYSKNSGIVV